GLTRDLHPLDNARAEHTRKKPPFECKWSTFALHSGYYCNAIRASLPFKSCPFAMQRSPEWKIEWLKPLKKRRKTLLKSL
ncbi:hypothetical protein, partial [Prevotella sp.]|uniref:hypothetical protein n=1 Tax=Prevotella sp. TaxID=59823 RepID=UPI0030768A08